MTAALQETHKDNNIPPWYKQFWPWFLIILPGVVVIASIGLVILAFHKADQLIDENYYNNGLAINTVKHDIEQAALLGITVDLTLSKTERQWRFEAQYSALNNSEKSRQPHYLLVTLEHPLEQSLDQTLLLRSVGSNYIAYFDLTTTQGHSEIFKFEGKQFWYIDIQPANALAQPISSWRLKGRFYSSDTQLTLGQP